MQPAMLGEGHIRIYGTLQIGHTVHEGHQAVTSVCSAGRFLTSNIMESVMCDNK